MHLLIEQIDYDGRDGNVTIRFHPTGIKTLAEDFLSGEEKAA